MEVLEAMKSRRSVRRYKPDPVDDRTLQAVLEAAAWAPSWANTQCWRFIVVRDSRMKLHLAETLNPGNPSTEAIRNAPLVIVACAELKRAGYYHGEPCTDKGDWFMFDVALAMENLALAAHAMGLGTVHVGRFDAKKVAEILGMPDGFCAVEMTPLGYPESELPAGPARRPITETVFHEKFGAAK